MIETQAPAHSSRAQTAGSADRVVKRFDGLVAIDGVSLSVRVGEILGLIGPNGSGKTTMLNLLSGVLAPSEGTVSVSGVTLAGLRVHEVAALGVARTFQQIRLFPEMSVRENVEVGALGHGIQPEPGAVRDLLERVGLAALSERRAGTLAYGVQRRLEIARALAGRPTLLLLDEPAAGMNEAESDALLATIEQARRAASCAVLIVDHDLRLIMRLCDRIHVLAEGRTICEDEPAAVREDPAVVEAYLGASGAEPRATKPTREGEAPDAVRKA